MMLPTLISVSVAPVSYFFWADAVEVEAAMSASASDAAASLPVTAGIPISLFLACVRLLFLPCLFLATQAQFNTICLMASRKSPRGKPARAASLVGRMRLLVGRLRVNRR